MALAVAGLVLALTGCSGGADAPAPSASASSTASPAPSGPSSGPAPSASSSSPAPSAGAADGLPAVLLEDGLGLVDPLDGSVSRAVLGGPVDAALAVGLAAFGVPPQPDPSACTLDERDSWVWQDGLVVYARDGLFLGWTVRPDSPAAALTTLTGIGIGSSGADLQATHGAPVETTSLGEEFAIGQLSGVLDAAGETGRVIALWGGDGCVAR